MRRHPNPVLSRVKATETYFAISHELGFQTVICFVRQTNKAILWINFSPVLPPESRLTVLHLHNVRIDNGETLQSFRLGCTLTVAFSSSSLADIMANVGWSNPNTASYYLKLEDIIRAGALSDRLASNLFTVDSGSC